MLEEENNEGKNTPCNAQERMTYLTTNLFCILVYNISVLRGVNKLSQMSRQRRAYERREKKKDETCQVNKGWHVPPDTCLHLRYHHECIFNG